MKNVGMCYQFGHGVNESMKKAIYWYEKALEVIDDPELAQKVMIFKTMPDIDEEDAGWEPPAGYMDALDSFMEDDEEEPCNIVFAGKIFVLTGLDTIKLQRLSFLAEVLLRVLLSLTRIILSMMSGMERIPRNMSALLSLLVKGKIFR